MNLMLNSSKLPLIEQRLKNPKRWFYLHYITRHESTYTISRELSELLRGGISSTAINTYLRHYNIPIREKTCSQRKPFSVEEIKSLYAKGLSMKKIAEKYGVTSSKIFSKLRG